MTTKQIFRSSQRYRPRRPASWLVTPETDREWLASLPASASIKRNGVDEEGEQPRA
jgi:hypothetical protein